MRRTAASRGFPCPVDFRLCLFVSRLAPGVTVTGMDVLSDAVAAVRTGPPLSSRQVLRPPWSMRTGPLAGAGFHVVLQGTGWLTPDRKAPVRLGAGDVVLVPHGASHTLSDTPGSGAGPPQEAAPAGQGSDAVAGPDETVLLCGAYHLEQGRLHPLLRELPGTVHLPARVGHGSALRSAVDLLGAELAAPRPGSDGVVPALLDALLLYVLRAWYADQARGAGAAPARGWAGALSDPQITAALRALHREPARQWTVQSLGAEGGLSRAPFARRFAALAGRPPLGYLTWWRMTVAARLLRESDAPVRAIAERVGYGSEFAFSKAFKREYGEAPGRYRAGSGGPVAAGGGDGNESRRQG